MLRRVALRVAGQARDAAARRRHRGSHRRVQADQRRHRPAVARRLPERAPTAAGARAPCRQAATRPDPAGRRTGDAPRDARSVIGQAARRPLRAGSAVSAKDVAVAQVIKTNDLVSVAYEADGIKLVLQGRALGPAAAGGAFSVINPGSKKEIQAIATGPGTAIVGPQADRLRVALQSDPRLLASLR